MNPNQFLWQHYIYAVGISRWLLEIELVQNHVRGNSRVTFKESSDVSSLTVVVITAYDFGISFEFTVPHTPTKSRYLFSDTYQPTISLVQIY